MTFVNFATIEIVTLLSKTNNKNTKYNLREGLSGDGAICMGKKL